MKWKVCGLLHTDNIQEISDFHPDYMGFIFYEKSPRFYTHKTIPKFHKSIQKVGVFVNATEAEIKKAITQYELDVIQLHGEESVSFCKQFQKENVKIVKAFSVQDVSDLQPISAYEDAVDFFLLDTKGKHYGGNGVHFDWNILEFYPSKKPLILSGGIGIEDITKIKKLPFSIHAIDINSKFEITPGLKNISLIQQLKNEIHSR